MPALEVASRVAVTTAEGPGRRFALWVQGCSLRCPGCCNPHLFAAGRGSTIPVDALLAEIARAAREHALEGITVLGGEPLEQRPGLTALCRGAAALGLGVLVFSGLRLEEARALPGFEQLWPHVDTLVDGRYDRRRPEPPPERGGRRFIGSTNQRLHHRSERYADPALWCGPPRVEIQLEPDGGFSAHGEPRALADLLHALERR
ncbi:MAG: radical SAM protein [Myxococcales bacterium]|nr:radical SAM protein [Myxococcales bacterium]